MRSAVLFLVAVASFAAVRAQQAPCTPPNKLFEARIVEVDREKGFEIFSRLSYDGEGQRIRTIEEILTQDSKTYYENILLFSEKMHYRIQFVDRQPTGCTKTEITFPFQPYEPPRSAKYFGGAVIGSNAGVGEGVEVENYGGEVDMPDGTTARYVGTWTLKGCLPVHDGYFSQKTGFVNVDFFDVTLGVEDVNIFNPPDICFQ